MKPMHWILGPMAAAALMLSGCGKEGAGGVDTGPLEKSFASADAPKKEAADKAVAAIKAGNYSGGFVELQKLTEQQASMTPEQRQAVSDTLEQVKKQVSAGAATVGGDAEKAAGDLKKSTADPQ